ncbi:MAG: hypothetical protein HC808_11525 [Candidatus Competibacteraceae bacterium]|nr:hypothetical protein [Candidatus Competibacteraceae bacterium]
MTALVQKGLPVVERSQLEKILKEQQLSYSGLFDLSSAQQVGKLLGADGVVLGAIADQGNSVAVNARLVELGTASVVAATEVEIAKTPMITQGLDRVVVDTAVVVRPGGAPSSTAPQNTDALFFEDDRVRIDVVSFRQEVGSLLLTLKYTNRTKGKLGLKLCSPRENTYLVNEKGVQYAFKEAEMVHQRDLPPSAPRISTIVFRGEVAPDNNRFTFSSEYCGYPSVRSLFASIAGLMLEPK